MTSRFDCSLLFFTASSFLVRSFSSFLLIFLLCLHPFSYFIVSWLVWAALLGYFFGLYGLFFPWLVLNKTKSSRLHSGVVPCCILLPHLIHLGSDDKNFAESAQTPMLIVAFLFSFDLLSSCFCFFFLSLPPGNCSSCFQA